MTEAGAAQAIQQTVNRVIASTDSDDAVLAAPSDGGVYFMTGRRPALPELMLLPGLVDSPADEAAAIQQLERQRVGLAVVGSRDFSPYGFQTFGRDFDTNLGRWLRDSAVKRVVVGDPAFPAAGTYPSRGFELLALRPDVRRPSHTTLTGDTLATYTRPRRMAPLQPREAQPATETAPLRHVAGFDQRPTALARAHPLRILARVLLALLAALACFGAHPDQAKPSAVVTVNSLTALQNPSATLPRVERCTSPAGRTAA